MPGEGSRFSAAAAAAFLAADAGVALPSLARVCAAGDAAGTSGFSSATASSSSLLAFLAGLFCAWMRGGGACRAAAERAMWSGGER